MLWKWNSPLIFRSFLIAFSYTIYKVCCRSKDVDRYVSLTQEQHNKTCIQINSTIISDKLQMPLKSELMVWEKANKLYKWCNKSNNNIYTGILGEPHSFGAKLTSPNPDFQSSCTNSVRSPNLTNGATSHDPNRHFSHMLTFWTKYWSCTTLDTCFFFSFSPTIPNCFIPIQVSRVLKAEVSRRMYLTLHVSQCRSVRRFQVISHPGSVFLDSRTTEQLSQDEQVSSSDTVSRFHLTGSMLCPSMYTC